MRTKTGPQDRPLRAVVCDDATDLRDLVADLLRLRGHEVSVVGDGPAAIQLIVAERPDVALIDIGLPEVDGCELARLLRLAMVETPGLNTRLVALTGYSDGPMRESAGAAGFDAYVVKPIMPEALEALLGA